MLDEACKRILWSRYGLDNYNWLIYYELAENKDELRAEYNKLKSDMLGPYFKPEDEFQAV